MKRRAFLAFLLLLATSCAILFGGSSARAERQELALGMWYWHAPFHVPASDLELLQEMNVSALYVKAGTFTTREEGIVLVMPQEWRSRAVPLDIHLTFHFDRSMVKGLEHFTIDEAAERIAERIRRELARAKQEGVSVAGIQFDLDSPTRLLPHYAALVKGVRDRLGEPRLIFSATALPTWLASEGVRPLLDAVDMLVPQFYENTMPTTVDELHPILDLKALEGGLRKVGRLPGKFAVGLPAYGHCMLFDGDGKLAGMYRKLPPELAVQHPSLAVRRSEIAREGSGEHLLLVEATEGPGKGQSLGYRIPTPEMLRRAMRALAENTPANVKEVILFRYPNGPETLCLSLRAQAASLLGRSIAPKLEAAVDTHLSSAKSGAGEIQVKVSNRGWAATFVRADSVEVVVAFDRGGLVPVERGPFDAVHAGQIARGEFKPGPLSTASAFRFRLSRLAEGETVETLWIPAPAGAESVQITVMTRGGDGSQRHELSVREELHP